MVSASHHMHQQSDCVSYPQTLSAISNGLWIITQLISPKECGSYLHQTMLG